VPRPGLRGLAYVLVALAVEHINPGAWRRNPAVQGVLAAAGSLFVEVLYFAVARRDWPGGPEGALRVAAVSALLTGLAALAMGWPLNRLAGAFNWPPSGMPRSWSQLVAAAGAGVARAPRRGKG